MAELSTETLTVEIEGVGFQSDKILSYSINSNFMTPTDSWEFVVWSDDPQELRRRWRPFQPVKLYVTGNQQVIGRIDGTQGVGDNGSLRVYGRDYLADLVNPTVDPSFQFKKEQDLGAALLALFEPFGITQVFGTNLNANILTGKRPYGSGGHIEKKERALKASRLEDYKAEENQGVFELADRLASRLGFMIQPGGTRDSVVVVAPNYEQAALYRVARPGNLKSGSANRDYSSVPTVTIARGRGSDKSTLTPGTRSQFPTFGEGAPSSVGLVKEVQRTITSDDGVVVVKETRFDPKVKDRTVYGFDVPVYRPMFYRDKDSRNQEQLERGLKRMIAERLRSTLDYEGTLRGHSDADGAVYSVDTIIHVDDAIEDVSEDLWIYDRTLKNDGKSGPETDIKCIRPQSYVL